MNQSRSELVPEDEITNQLRHTEVQEGRQEEDGRQRTFDSIVEETETGSHTVLTPVTGFTPAAWSTDHTYIPSLPLSQVFCGVV